MEEAESPFICTISNYHVATGGIDKTSCFKTLAGKLISGAIGGEQERSSVEDQKKKKIH